MIYCFDIDGTLCNVTDGDYPKAVPRLGVIELLNGLYDEGHTIFVHTARGSTSGLEWRELTEKQLKSWKVKYHRLVMGKPGADVFIDDKCIHISDFTRGRATLK